MVSFPNLEQKILRFWQENKIFEKLREKNKNNERWSFLDGPITANNPMGVHHAWGRTYKDVFQRYKAMAGFDQRFQNGFDCQGLWVEVEVEKELGFKTKKDIEKYGIDKFVEKCKERVLKYSKIQTEQSIRLGQWMDWENSYFTMSDENNYAIWHFLKKCWQDGNLYKGRDCVPWCPRCGTAISQHEILTEEYKLLTHEAIYFKLPIIEGQFKGAKFLIWTTTPWTIPANVALAINPEFEYGLYEDGGEKLILAKDLAEKVLDKNYVLKKSFKGEELKGTKYQGPFDNLPRVQKAKNDQPETFHSVVLDKDLVTAEEGTGIVHIAPGAGEEDFQLGAREKLAVIDVIDESAVYLDGMAEFSGQNAKERPEIIFDYLKKYQGRDFFYKTESYTHRYPNCWRCSTELVWRVVDEWYIAMDKPSKSKVKSQKSKSLREELINIAREIKWIPEFGLERELDWLKNMHDWLISKKRYWGLALPIYECACGHFEVIGSKEELKERAVEGWEKFNSHSPHRPWVDAVKIKCSKCGKTVSRISDVGNPWLDAGIVSFSTLVDPSSKRVSYLDDRKYWQKWFPFELVCESFPGQFKNWFYSIIVMSVVLEKAAPVKTIFGYALVKDEQGEEMHKTKGNAIWFDEAAEKIGVEPMRWLYVKQNPADNLRFGYKAIEETARKLLTLYNVFEFFKLYGGQDFIVDVKSQIKPEHILDRWIISKLNLLIKKATESLDRYNPAAASLAIEDFFINDLSLWYLRRSRQRFQRPQKEEEKRAGQETLYFVLFNLAKLIAPMMPFLAEEIYCELKTPLESVHLESWPKFEAKLVDNRIIEQMDLARKICEVGHRLRAAAGIKVRQPLKELRVKDHKLKGNVNLLGLIKDEVNVKEIVFDSAIQEEIELETKITPELKDEGLLRELIRQINTLRKEAKLTTKDKIKLYYQTESKSLKDIFSRFADKLKEATLSQDLIDGESKGAKIKKEIKIDGEKITLTLC